MKYQMLNELVAVEPLSRPSEKTTGDIFVSVEDKSSTGIVQAIGPGIPSFLQGKKVYFGTKRDDMRINGKTLHVMKIDNIFAVVEDET